MAEFLLDLFCEEIPAGMQQRAAQDLKRLLEEALSALKPRQGQYFYGMRRISAIIEIEDLIAETVITERGPRETAPEKALEGFMRKHNVSRDALVRENGFWLLKQARPSIMAEAYIARILPEILWKFPWPKAMRWGNGSLFTWVRPLRHITCLLDGQIVHFSLARDGDAAHQLASSNQTEGHRFLSSGVFKVKNAKDWQDQLAAHHVVLKAEERKSLINKGVHQLAREKGLILVEDDALIEEIAGLVEYPVPLLGQIDQDFMDLPPEVMQVSMRINQRYFALRDQTGKAAPYFAFIANRNFADGGTLCIAGNERVLRARFADARHFWDLDRKIHLADRVDALGLVTFHAKLGTQKFRAERISILAGQIARAMGLSRQNTAQAERAGLLAKADLTTGMVGEFPELQGVMGGYYAAHDGEDASVARAIGAHYKPRGQNDDVPSDPVCLAVGLADRLDMLAGFFTIGETPSGSGDPYGLRRSALAIIRLVRENTLRIDLGRLLFEAARPFAPLASDTKKLEELESFFADRLRVQLRNEGQRHDVLDATLAAHLPRAGETLFPHALDGDFTRLLGRVSALAEGIGTEEGRNLLAAYKRAANILRIENKKDGPHHGALDSDLYVQEEERALGSALTVVAAPITHALKEDNFSAAMQALSKLRIVMDHFFEAVTVNDDDAARRRNRLRLLSAFVSTANQIADFGKIEG